MIRNLKYVLLLIFTFLFGIVNAQENVLTTGGDIQSEAGSVAFSVGQVQFNSKEGPTGSVSEGIQQTYTIIETALIDNGIELKVKTGPNPFQEYLIINAQQCAPNTIRFELYDTNGLLLQKGTINDQEQVLETSKLAASIYFIHLIDINTPVKKVIKVIKNK